MHVVEAFDSKRKVVVTKLIVHKDSSGGAPLLLLLNPVCIRVGALPYVQIVGMYVLFAMLCAWECYYVSIHYFKSDDLLSGAP